ncbi:MAG: hypothetical protein IJ421_08525 [Prevotella sp.]|nr:hypothetical protein [Prevotella sp.]MBQ8629502.1 hypothetical protein [Prevotella sp.]
MKKNLLSLLCLLILSSSANAQIKIIDTFDGMSSLDWTQYADKDVSALTNMGFLELKVKKEGFYINSSTDLPILTEYDFKITIKMVIPKFDEKETSAILFDMNENFKRLAFIFQENKFIACTYNNGKFSMDEGEEVRIKLPKKKDRPIEVTIERKGGKIIISYDNIEIFRWKRQLHSPYLGFITSSHLKIDEVIVDQEYTGDEEQ